MIMNICQGTTQFKFSSLSVPCMFLLATCDITSEESKCGRYEDKKENGDPTNPGVKESLPSAFKIFIKTVLIWILSKGRKRTQLSLFILSHVSLHIDKTYTTSSENQRQELLSY